MRNNKKKQENYEEKTNKKQEARKRCGNILNRCRMKTIQKKIKKDGG